MTGAVVFQKATAVREGGTDCHYCDCGIFFFYVSSCVVFPTLSMTTVMVQKSAVRLSSLWPWVILVIKHFFFCGTVSDLCNASLLVVDYDRSVLFGLHQYISGRDGLHTHHTGMAESRQGKVKDALFLNDNLNGLKR